jgi:hypothetical protein
MSVKFANNAFGTLNAGINNSATSITLSSGQGARFPTLASGEYFYATLIDTSNNLEVVKCTARSTDVLTITRAQESTAARAFAIGDRVELRVTAQGLDDAANPYDKGSSSTGSFGLPKGTTAQQPTASATEGHIRYDTDDDVVYYSNGTSWLKISSIIAILNSVSGNLYAGAATTLTLTGKGFQTANLVVNFTQSSDSIDENVTVTPTSDTAATVTVPSSVFSNVTAGNVVSISATNSDGTSSGSVSKTALAQPTGGTITTYGSYRVHSFTSSGSFVVDSNSSALSSDILIVAGGGGGGRAGSTGRGGNGDDSSFGSNTSIGGGGGGGSNDSDTAQSGNNGGSGGGGGGDEQNGDSPGGSGTSGQGNNGGGGSGHTAGDLGGGGGGAGAVGQTQISGSKAGNGGNGLANDFRTGSNVTYAGGGGGGTNSGDGQGGTGGGGNGGDGSSNAQNGDTNKGSGGGGGAGSGSGGGGGAGGMRALTSVSVSPGSTTVTVGGGGSGPGSGTFKGGNGGSGIVVIRYQLA